MIERVLVTRLVDIKHYIELREKFLETYENIAKTRPIENQFEDVEVPEVRDRVKTAGDRSENYNPHSIIFDPIRKSKQIFRSLYWVALILVIPIWIFGRVGTEFISLLITIPNIWSILLNIGVPITWIFVVVLYFETLRRDTKFVQVMNEQLLISEQVVDSEEDKDKLISYLLWNRGLSSNTTLPVLAMLTLLGESWLDLGFEFANDMAQKIFDDGMNGKEAFTATFSAKLEQMKEEDIRD